MSTEPLANELAALKQRALAGDIGAMRESYRRGELQWLQNRMTPERYAHLGVSLDSGDLESVRSDLATVESPVEAVVNGDQRSLLLQGQRNGLIAVAIIVALAIVALLGFLAFRNNDDASDTTAAIIIVTDTVTDTSIAETVPETTASDTISPTSILADTTLPSTLPPPSTALATPVVPASPAISAQTTIKGAAQATTPPTPSVAPPVTVAGERKSDVLSAAERSSTFSAFLAMIDAAGLREEILALNPSTVLAPTESAFSSLSPEVQAGLKSAENKAILARIVRYNVIPQAITLRQFTTSNVKSWEGSTLSVVVGNNKVAINDAMVTGADVLTITGVLHATDKLLLPPGVSLNALVPKPVPAPTLATQTIPPTQPVAATTPATQPPATTPPAAATTAVQAATTLAPTTTKLP